MGAGLAPGDDSPTTTTTPDGATAVLEIYPLDIWAQPLPAEVAELTVEGGASLDGYSPARIYLADAGTFAVHLEAAHHEALEVTVDYDGTAGATGASIESATEGHGAVMAHATEALAGREVPVHRLYLGLRHKWFSAEGRPARRGNAVEIFTNGEAAWAALHDDLRQATDEILTASWWWESSFELVRDPARHAELSSPERWQNTMLGVLEASSATVRVLLGQFWSQDGALAAMNVDAPMLAYAGRADDGIEYLGQANETQGKFEFAVPSFLFSERLGGADPALAEARFDVGEAPIESTVPSHFVDLSEWPVEIELGTASYHQKFSVIDHEIAHVGGMNVKAADWDTAEHRVFEPRRMKFDATAAERQAVMNKEAEPDCGPRKDYAVRVEGPAAEDAADIFKQRWDLQLAQGVEYAENASPFEVVRDVAPRPNGLQVQMTTTLPEPFWEHAIAESWFNAVRNAERFILIEDQYFRVPMLNQAILERMRQVPGLVLVVVTKPINEWVDPGCAQTYLADELFERHYPDRYFTFQLRSFDTVVTWGFDETESRFVDLDLHAKLLLVDDLFISVGSANKNNRGLVYEGELNVALVDAATATAVRHELLATLVSSWTPTDDVVRWVADLRATATANDAVYARWEAEGHDIDLDGAPLPAEYRPNGLVYSLEFGDVDDCSMESIGPDMTNESEASG